EERSDGRADRQDHPERQVQIEVRAREQGIGIRAHGVEGDVAEIEQSGEADDDVETEREQHIEDRVVRNPYPGGADLREREGQHRQSDRDQRDTAPQDRRVCAPILQARSPTRSPSRPEGRNTSTRISTMNANTSW